jgi:ribosomal protein S18 acetylase RimI-like enzyme
MARIEIERARGDEVPWIARLHCQELAGTVHSSLGRAHLERVYRAILSDADSFLAVARNSEGPDGLSGFTVACLNVDALARSILSSMTLSQRGLSALGLVGRPWLWPFALQSFWTGRPVGNPGGPVSATLIAIATVRSSRGQGVGKALVSATCSFFRQRGVRAFRLDTRRRNRGAREFYRRLGFVEVARRGFDCVLLKEP